MTQSCIGRNGIGRLVQYDRRMNATFNASLLQDKSSESISDMYWNQAKIQVFSIIMQLFAEQS